MFSVVIPIYRNEDSIPELLSVLQQLDYDLKHQLGQSLEALFVVDGSPDQSTCLLEVMLEDQPFSSILVELSKNFGSFQAIRAGFEKASGDYVAIMTADLQEPPSLMMDLFRTLLRDHACDVVVAARKNRQDPWSTKFTANLFWALYRRFVQTDIPEGGFDIFACNRPFRAALLRLNESHSSLVGQAIWLGFRRKIVEYQRQPRLSGKSAWTIQKKCRYLLDSLFSFTDLPIWFLFFISLLSFSLAGILSSLIVISKLVGWVTLPGYTMSMTIVCFFSGLNALGLGIIGMYVWRTYENTKNRPLSVPMKIQRFQQRPDRQNDLSSPILTTRSI